jgi:cytosine/adenosine deaminase-related metal-dependent hydrolase
MTRTLITGGCVISMDPTVGDLRRGDILVERGRIAAIAPHLDAADAVRFDASDFIVLPGLVDTHRHTWQSCVRHRMGDVSFWTYCALMLRDLAAHYEPEDVYAGNLLGALSALEAGTTTMVDWSQIQNTPVHADAAIQALRDSGMRAVFAHGWPRADGPSWVVDSERSHPADIRRIRRDLLSSDEGLVTLAMAARGPEMTRMEITAQDFRLARELGIRSTMHVGIRDLGPKFRAVEKMNQAGLLGPDLTVIHACASSEAELKMLAANGVTVSIGPQAEMTMDELGVMAIGRLLAAGIRPSLSGDTETAGSGDLFTQMRLALAGERQLSNNRLFAGHASALSVREVLEFATIAGAQACGLERRAGSLSPGKDADLIFVRQSDLNLTPVSDAVGAVVLAAHPGNVDTVMVAGKIVKQAGRLVGHDLDKLRERARASRDRLLACVGSETRP